MSLLNIDFFLNWKLFLKPWNIIPNFSLKSIFEINNILDKCDIKGIIIDIDQTITVYGSDHIDNVTLQLLNELSNNYKLCFLSNYPKSKKSFVRFLKIENVTTIKTILSDKKKPDASAFLEALNYLKTDPRKSVMIGDRLFTDIIGANNMDLITVLVKPINPKSDPVMIQISRLFESFFLRIISYFFNRGRNEKN